LDNCKKGEEEEEEEADENEDEVKGTTSLSFEIVLASGGERGSVEGLKSFTLLTCGLLLCNLARKLISRL